MRWNSFRRKGGALLSSQGARVPGATDQAPQADPWSVHSPHQRTATLYEMPATLSMIRKGVLAGLGILRRPSRYESGGSHTRAAKPRCVADDTLLVAAK